MGKKTRHVREAVWNRKTKYLQSKLQSSQQLYNLLPPSTPADTIAKIESDISYWNTQLTAHLSTPI